MKQVLVDTSIWIDFFRCKAFTHVIQELACDGRLTTCGLVQAELLPFVKKQRRQVEAYFAEMSYLSFDDLWWVSLIAYREQLLRRGFDLGIPDLILITLAKEYDVLLFTRDQDFLRVKDILKLRFFEPN